MYVYEEKEKDGVVLQRRNTGTTKGKKKEEKTRDSQHTPKLPTNNFRVFPSYHEN